MNIFTDDKFEHMLAGFYCTIVLAVLYILTAKFPALLTVFGTASAALVGILTITVGGGVSHKYLDGKLSADSDSTSDNKA